MLLFVLVSNVGLFRSMGQVEKATDGFTGAHSEVYQTEVAFQKMTEADGIQSAFVFYAAASAVLHRNGKLVEGKEAIQEFYGSPMYESAKVQWTPDHIELAGSGDLAYSYGKYVWFFPDASGKMTEYPGIYLTIWKRQPDGTWKYVWD